MKVDGLGVILAIILLPIILVTTLYIQRQVDTIATENSYNTKLLDATYDAMSAFEINTANEEMSTIGDSMRSIIMASNNIFFNTLATNFGVSNANKEQMQEYVPAVLYTMYDGFYIYAPTQTPVVAEKTTDGGDNTHTTSGYVEYGIGDAEDTSQIDGDGVVGDVVYEADEAKTNGKKFTTNRSNAKMDTDYMLKSYIQYSARYKHGSDIDVTINYTLDNYLNIVGTIGGIYYTKTGYLIDQSLVEEYSYENMPDESYRNETDAKNAILGNESGNIGASNSAYVTVKGKKIEGNFEEKIKNKLGSLGYEPNLINTIKDAKLYLQKAYDEKWDLNDSYKSTIRDIEYEIQKYDAIAYYVSSKLFSDWVYANLSELTYGDLQNGALKSFYDSAGISSTSGVGEDDLYYSFTGDTTKIFTSNDPEATDSNFNTHRIEVIKNSIKYNLNLAMSDFNRMSDSFDASMPILLDEEWDKILNNISIVSFMQGLDCGLDVYNNYEIASSTNNELTVTPNEIFYVKKDEFNNESSNYHRIDCPYFEETTGSEEYISFKSKEVKYDKVYDSSVATKYKYDHKNLACYTCINTNNYEDESLFLNPNVTSYYDRIASLKKSKTSTSADSDSKRLAAYIGIAHERQRTYKTNALPVSEGYRIYNNNSGWSSSGGNITVSGLDLKNATKLEVNFSDLKNDGTAYSEPILQLTVGNNNKKVDLVLDNAKPQTVPLDLNECGIPQSQNGSITFNNQEKIKVQPYKIKSVKVIYK